MQVASTAKQSIKQIPAGALFCLVALAGLAVARYRAKRVSVSCRDEEFLPSSILPVE